jgi:predicted double-glycine peptidase
MGKLLDIPDVRQRSDYDCGRAALRAVFGFWGVTYPKRHAGLTNPEQGTHPDTAGAILRDAGFRLIEGSASVDILAAFTRAGWPVLSVMTQAGGGHWVVVRGVSRGRVYYHCPSHGPRSMPAAEFESRWDDRDRGNVGYWRWVCCPWRHVTTSAC